MTYLDIAKAQLRVDEGWKQKPYKDTVGKWTIGCGRNLDDVGLRDDEIDYLLDNDLRVAENTARALFPSFDNLSENRKAVLLNMSMNLGQQRLAGFTKFRQAVAEEAWEQAAGDMMDSKWAEQVGNRAVRLAQQMRQG